MGRILLGLGAIVVVAQRLSRARDAYNQAVARGSKPIEGVGTAVAAFVGLDVR